MIPFDPHPACRKCGSSMTTWEWALSWGRQETKADGSVEIDEEMGEALRVTCVRCGFAWLMASKEEKE